MAQLADARSSSNVQLRTGAVARAFVVSLVPIAVAYQYAHYQSLFMTTSQFAVPLASDPLGVGWNLLGTASARVDLFVVDVRWLWYSAVAAIVAGHVAAVHLAHVIAFDVYRTRRDALASQLPLLALMVVYTMTSLWILAQPIAG